MADGDFSLVGIASALQLINHLLTVAQEQFRAAARPNARFFAYDGFNAQEILNSFFAIFRNTPETDALMDLCDIVNIGLTRGNIREDQLEKTVQRGRDRIKELSEKYQIKMRANLKSKIALSRNTITFPRMISVFPYVASQLIVGGACIVESNGCKFGSDELPPAMKHSGFASLIPVGDGYCACIFYCYLAYMISFGRKINPNNKDDDITFYNKQLKFTRAAWTNISVTNNDYRIKAFANLGLNSHTRYGAVYIKVCNALLKSVGETEITEAALQPFIVNGVWGVSRQAAPSS